MHAVSAAILKISEFQNHLVINGNNLTLNFNKTENFSQKIWRKEINLCTLHFKVL